MNLRVLYVSPAARSHLLQHHLVSRLLSLHLLDVKVTLLKGL